MNGKAGNESVSWRTITAVVALGVAGGGLLPSEWDWGARFVIALLLIVACLALCTWSLLRMAVNLSRKRRTEG